MSDECRRGVFCRVVGSGSVRQGDRILRRTHGSNVVFGPDRSPKAESSGSLAGLAIDETRTGDA